MTDKFDNFVSQHRAELIALLTELQADIDDDYRATDGPDDDVPAMMITIGTDDELSGLSWQTGDNSYTGGCYGSPYWGVGSIARDDDPAACADALLDDLGDNWASNNS
jgi:hypothetical protein